MSTLTLISALIAVIGLAFSVTGFKRFFQRRLLAGVWLECSGALFLVLALSSFLLASNLYTYQRLVYEQAVAEVTFKKVANQQYQAEIQALDSGFHQVVNLNGDEWQLDAQVLTWNGLGTLFGFDANYRLHRIAGRYLDITEEQQRPRSVYSLLKPPKYFDDQQFDLWKYAHEYKAWLSWVDAAYGSAVFLPMTDGAKYKVAISRTGLIARPDNSIARKAVSRWIGL